MSKELKNLRVKESLLMDYIKMFYPDRHRDGILIAGGKRLMIKMQIKELREARKEIIRARFFEIINQKPVLQSTLGK